MPYGGGCVEPYLLWWFAVLCDLPEFNGALGVVASLGGISKLAGAFSSLTVSGITGSSCMNLTICKPIIKTEPFPKYVVQLHLWAFSFLK